MKRLIGLFAVAALFAWGAGAQEQRIEATGDYSYFRFNPGLPSYFNSHSLNGGGGAVTFFLTPNVGIMADFQGYGSTTFCTNLNAPLSGCASGTLFTYMFGPQFKMRRGRFEPFAEVLVGGAHSGFYGNACRNVTGACLSTSPSNNAFAFAVGGGFDFNASRRIAIRIFDADYVLTRFGNNFTHGNNSQSNFRFQTGVQFRF